MKWRTLRYIRWRLSTSLFVSCKFTEYKPMVTVFLSRLCTSYFLACQDNLVDGHSIGSQR
jgi:hypothetical protein